MDTQPYLLFANVFYIRMLSLNLENYTMLARNIGVVRALDYDHATNKLFYIQEGSGLLSMNLRTGEDRTTISKITHFSPDSHFCVDWIGRKLYYSNIDIFVSELNGTFESIVHDNGNRRERVPSFIVCDSYRKYIYYMELSHPVFLAKMGMDGSDWRVIVDKERGEMDEPASLALDPYGGWLYWADKYFGWIRMTDLNGKYIKTLLHIRQVTYVRSMAVFDGRLYWSDFTRRTLESANQFNATDRKILINETIHPPYSMVVVHPAAQRSAPNPCEPNNGGCSHLCLQSPTQAQGFQCACPVDFKLDANGKKCVANCTNTQFKCGPTDERCIPKTWFCDSERDCRDGSDEPDNCPTRTCGRGLFQCNDNNGCVYPSQLCNGVSECRDGSDEFNCNSTVCNSREFRCNSGQCIPKWNQCNVNRDCRDGSDEAPLNTHCTSEQRQCPAEYFKCNNGNCIPQSWVCDFDDDCRDGSDEPSTCSQTRNCSDLMFKCASNYRCIQQFAVCDGINDCRDNSDENRTMCQQVTCHHGEFRCGNGRCIQQYQTCDTVDDCNDGSDENATYCAKQSRQCTEDEFRCSTSGRCISSLWRCDGDDDCGDHSDEDNCASINCGPLRFHCNSTEQCIPNYRRCDRNPDCPDGSDESNCPEVPCSASQFQCDNKRCIPMAYVCDGDNDCRDNSDEVPRSCSLKPCNDSGQWQCEISKKCIRTSDLCDQRQQCIVSGVNDTSDESPAACEKALTLQLEQNCPSNSVKCHTGGRCVPASKLCDGVPDCCPEAIYAPYSVPNRNSTHYRNCEITDEIGCFFDGGSCNEDNGGCEQTCITVNGTNRGKYYCGCRSGFVVSKVDRRQCEDIDECQSPLLNNCTHICSNRKGSYLCSCNDGFIREPMPVLSAAMNYSMPSLFICRANTTAPTILVFILGDSVRMWSQRQDNTIYTNVFQAQLNSPGSSLAAFSALEIDFRDGTVIYAGENSGSYQVNRTVLPVNGSVADPMNLKIRNLGEIVDLGIDFIGDNLYIADVTQDVAKVSRILVTLTDGRYQKTIVRNSTGKITAMTVNPLLGKLYYAVQYSRSVYSTEVSLIMCNMDGSNNVSIFSGVNNVSSNFV